MNLYPYQETGAAFLAAGKAKGVLLADEPGLGKTRQALQAVQEIIERGELSEVATIVCPASAVGVWRKEIMEAIGFDHALIDWRIASFNRIGELPDGPVGVLIIDEAHYLKTRDSGRTVKIFGEDTDGAGGLIERASHVILLTGTPTPNNPSELWPLARACFPKAIEWTFKDGSVRPMSFSGFTERYCRMKFDYIGRPKIVGGKNLAELRQRIAPYVLRRLKKDVLPDLPDVRFDVLPVVGSLRLDEGESVEARLIAETLAKFGVAGLKELAPHVASYRRVCGVAKVDGVCDWIEEWFKGGGGKLVLFAHHKEVIARLQARLSASKVQSVTVDGSVPVGKRALIARAFQESDACRVFIGQNEAAGVAITLTKSSTLLSLEPAWTPGVNDQIWQRIHRIGQKNACDIRYPTIAGSIDERVTRALLPKQGAIDALWN
jgi:SWI/SNF-related matrix-associated actin-dependent regulator 1 of chromatin subfamily A